MPKVSHERRTERLEQILSGARRCFAEHGYEGATVARLEEEIGLSRGAIFNYFPSKEDLFLELAWRDNERILRLWVEHGWEAALRSVVDEEPDWLGVYLEVTRKTRTNPDFARRHEERQDKEITPLIIEAIRADQERGAIRRDVTPEQVAGFISVVANGVVVQMASGEPIRDVETLVEFLRTAVAAHG
jgi:TetR/AcrR family transcriptional regulator, transcriptional repressor of aconitase